ncbi:predicted protein [Postia placenta Mad-698-R]|nr:predicted protein [Postia placenta Mad-698-R]
MAQSAAEGKISFHALLLANEQRSAYGLRYNDYERYRKHCANRTHRLRSSLKTTHGKGREFKKLPPLKTDAIKEGHLQLLLFEAERAWVYSQELSAQAVQTEAHPKSAAAKGHDTPSTLRRHATSRLRRAVNWSTQLLSHCQALYTIGRLSPEDVVQVTVYTLIVNGRFLRHRYDYEDALAQLSVARSLLDALAAKAATSRDQALATAFADEIGPEISNRPRKEHVDARLFPAIVKLLDTVVQSLDQMRTLTIVDESPDLASAVDARLSFTKARRCRYLARSYAPQKRYAEALTLTQHANLHLREARSILSVIAETDPITAGARVFYTLTAADVDGLEGEVAADSLQYKKDWFAFNGGSLGTDSKTYKKPLFFDIALNYVELDMERLQERAGKKPVAAKVAPQAHRRRHRREPG